MPWRGNLDLLGRAATAQKLKKFMIRNIVIKQSAPILGAERQI
jgi:hypothetical protein